MIHSLTKLICCTVNYKTSKSKVYKMYLLKLELLVRISRYLLVKGRNYTKCSTRRKHNAIRLETMPLQTLVIETLHSSAC
jgi:hypothetical protein